MPITDVYGLSLHHIDISLRVIYNDMLVKNNGNTLNSKENQKFFNIGIYIPMEILKFVYEDEDYIDQYLNDIERIFLYKTHKVVLKIDCLDVSDVDIGDISVTEQGNNYLLYEYDNDLKLDNFFKKYSDYITFRKIVNGSIKSNYKKVCNLLFYNNHLYKYNTNFKTFEYTGDKNVKADI